DAARLIDALEDGDRSVRLTAVRALARLRRPESIPGLIEALRRERGRLRAEVNDALAAVTGLGFPADPDRWARWWEKARADFRLPEKPASGKAAADDTVATFHSIPVVSEEVAFVIDRSGSMRDRLKKRDGATKAALVARELKATLSRLEPPARFLLVAFGDEPKAFAKKAVTATACTRGRALKWFGKQEPRGRTNLFDALALALDRPDVDTVFVLTDGAPSTGEYRLRREILTEVSRLNRYRKAVIHAVEIGGDTIGRRWRGFMRELAESAGGRYVKR
ncbi:MAG: HEAT repeat domain-containing protein, partial [Planctomycetota bacterium]